MDLPRFPVGAVAVELARPRVRSEVVAGPGPLAHPEAPDLAGSLRAAEALGRRLWDEARARAQGPTRDLDDRRLYWERLAAIEAVQRGAPPGLAEEDLVAQLDVLERASRGYAPPPWEPGALRVLVSGFDPFLLDPEVGGPDAIHRANPSGAAVLALSGRTLAVEGLRVAVRGVIFPVRYADFDAGVVEAVLGPLLDEPPDLLMTISQGRGADFAVEQWAGRRRSVTLPDNARAQGGGAEGAPVVPPGLGPGPEFLPTALPASAIWGVLGRAGPSPDEGTLWELREGALHAAPRPSPGSLAVRGSGGGYLSNEIFYRCVRMRWERGLSLPMGHLHTPFLAPPAGGGPDAEFESARARIVDDVARVVAGLAPTLARGRC